MEKEEYLSRLAEALAGLPESERADILRDYGESFDAGAAEGKTFEQLGAEFGSPELAAEELLRGGATAPGRAKDAGGNRPFFMQASFYAGAGAALMILIGIYCLRYLGRNITDFRVYHLDVILTVAAPALAISLKIGRLFRFGTGRLHGKAAAVSGGIWVAMLVLSAVIIIAAALAFGRFVCMMTQGAGRPDVGTLIFYRNFFIFSSYASMILLFAAAVWTLYLSNTWPAMNDVLFLFVGSLLAAQEFRYALGHASTDMASFSAAVSHGLLPLALGFILCALSAAARRIRRKVRKNGGAAWTAR